MQHASGGIIRCATLSMGRELVHKPAGVATQRKRAVQRKKGARRAEQLAQTAETIASFSGLARVSVYK